MLNIGDKLYHMDYEDSKASYTITSIIEVKDDEFMKDGTYYIIHADLLSNLTGYYQMEISNIDSEIGRFFSSKEKAKEMYAKWKKKKEGMKNE